jgi:hypothetical protein
MNELLNYKKYANKYGEQSHLIGRSSERSSVSPLALFYLVFNTTIHLIFLVLLLSLSLCEPPPMAYYPMYLCSHDHPPSILSPSRMEFTMMDTQN